MKWTDYLNYSYFLHTSPESIINYTNNEGDDDVEADIDDTPIKEPSRKETSRRKETARRKEDDREDDDDTEGEDSAISREDDTDGEDDTE